PASSSSTPGPSSDAMQGHVRPFEAVTANLMRLGTLSLAEFLRPPFHDPPPAEINLPSFSYVQRPASDITGDGEQNPKRSHTEMPIFILHQVCSQTFGSLEPLNYEIIDEAGREKRQCILTITRPNGSTRSYATKAEHVRKSEARAAAATVAVEMGALDFIKNGAPDHLLKKGLVLAPLDAPGSRDIEVEPVNKEEDENVRQISECCAKWRAGRVKPHWVELRDRPAAKYGYALRIQLSPHSSRVYSVDAIHDDEDLAKAMCAQDAISQGVLDYIMHGNGQKQPALPEYLPPATITDEETATPIAGLSLQGFFESLPRPFPEPVEGKSANDINAPSWLNVLVQTARGAKIATKFIWISDMKCGLHGVLLRIERPSECRSYLVDPAFPKRADAKAAVCLIAMSQGVGDYVRSIVEELDNKVSMETRQRVLDAYGCNMTLKLNTETSGARSWSVPADYRSRADAKLAVLELAFEHGAIEFLRFRGQPPPPGYVVQLPMPSNGADARKRKALPDEGDDEVPQQQNVKRQRASWGASAPSGESESTGPSPSGSARPKSFPFNKNPKKKFDNPRGFGPPNKGSGGGHDFSMRNRGPPPPHPNFAQERSVYPPPPPSAPALAPGYGSAPPPPPPLPPRSYAPPSAPRSADPYYAPRPADPYATHRDPYYPPQPPAPDPYARAEPYRAPHPEPYREAAPHPEPYRGVAAHPEPYRGVHGPPPPPAPVDYGHSYYPSSSGTYDYPSRPADEYYRDPEYARRPHEYPPSSAAYPEPAYPAAARAPPEGYYERGPYARDSRDAYIPPPADPYAAPALPSGYYLPPPPPPAPAPAPPPAPPPPHFSPSASSSTSSAAHVRHSSNRPPTHPYQTRKPPPPRSTPAQNSPRVWEPGPHSASGASPPPPPSGPAAAKFAFVPGESDSGWGARGGKQETGCDHEAGAGARAEDSTRENSRGKEREKEPERTDSRASDARPSSPPKSSKSRLIEHCVAENLPAPRFHHERRDADGLYHVWIVLGREKLELPSGFDDVEVGEEKVARQVLKRVQGMVGGK
ncbi:hypothetical protein OF83DRAFT_1159297, partial [Amylostereum chailletii]